MTLLDLNLHFHSAFPDRVDAALTEPEEVRGIETAHNLVKKLGRFALFPVWARYLIATALVCVSFIVRYLLNDIYPGSFVLFVPAIILVALLFDRRTAIYSCFLSAIFVLYFFVAPAFRFEIVNLNQFLSITIFILISLFIIYVVEILRGAINALEWRTQQAQIAEARLLHAQKMEAIGQAISILAHDFKNILSPIEGTITLLKTEVPDENKNAWELLELLGKMCADGRRITNDIMVFGRKEIEKAEACDLNHYINSKLAELKASLHDNITLKFNPEAYMPTIRVSSTAFQRALVNIITNAQDAMQHGGVVMIETRNVHLESEGFTITGQSKPGNYVCLSIRDTGTGMTAEQKSRVFEPFFTTKPTGKGTGLGMAMVADFVRQSGGYIAVESELGAGTAIKIYFPAYK